MSGITKNLPGAKRIITAIVGGTVVLIGVALLATEFEWAEGLLKKARAAIARKKEKPNDGTSQNRER